LKEGRNKGGRSSVLCEREIMAGEGKAQIEVSKIRGGQELSVNLLEYISMGRVGGIAYAKERELRNFANDTKKSLRCTKKKDI